MDNHSNLLDEALGFNSKARVSPSGRVVLIEDSVETSGSFVLHHLMKHALSLNCSGIVLFVALAQPFSHYDRILRKLGCNLVAQRDNNRLFFFDMLKLGCLDGDGGKIIEGQLLELYGKIQKTIETDALPDQSKNPITIMIDDISLMEVAAHGSSNHVLDFLHYCHTLTLGPGCSLVVLNHEDIYSSLTGPTLILEMEYIADIVIKAEPLATGLASDVHGQLMVVNKGIIDENGTLRTKLRNFHFKVKENSVEYFYPGSQS
ncbi:PREDICTED: elongator complex protein 6 [Nelumbo nucifera]|uniref:Elongator complex protein 6 n=2 Tax=Nelumbo nucifera TaxID=4432 RepID=A0A1U7ZNT7_NELNU|nr:PREDICTED: elongator complex protein 6 [Nelumbo nucifera]DAD26026.1 TPA_asm: hypothetical protein HUJ06_027494 [Nelumbo nucifera]